MGGPGVPVGGKARAGPRPRVTLKGQSLGEGLKGKLGVLVGGQARAGQDKSDGAERVGRARHWRSTQQDKGVRRNGSRAGRGGVPLPSLQTHHPGRGRRHDPGP